MGEMGAKKINIKIYIIKKTLLRKGVFPQPDSLLSRVKKSKG
jgi:hypothetical protein